MDDLDNLIQTALEAAKAVEEMRRKLAEEGEKAVGKELCRERDLSQVNAHKEIHKEL